MFWLYILECRDRTLYVGHADNLDERMRCHDAGMLDSYTALKRPLQPLFAQEFESSYAALAMERKLKGWGRVKSSRMSRATGTQSANWRKASMSMSATENASTPPSSTATLSANGCIDAVVYRARVLA